MIRGSIKVIIISIIISLHFRLLHNLVHVRERLRPLLCRLIVYPSAAPAIDECLGVLGEPNDVQELSHLLTLFTNTSYLYNNTRGNAYVLAHAFDLRADSLLEIVCIALEGDKQCKGKAARFITTEAALAASVHHIFRRD